MSTQIEEQRETEEEVETEPETESPGERRRAVKRERAAQREQEVEDALDEAEETVELKVFRYDPEVADKEEPRFDSFTVPYHKGMTVLDALIYARDVYDSSLTFRHSCRQAVCGSDALFVNGRQRLGCKTQMGDLVWQRLDPDRPLQVPHLCLATQALPAVDEQRVRPADGLPTGVAERERGVVVVPGVHQRVEDGHPLVERDGELVEPGLLLPLDLGVVAEHLQPDRRLGVPDRLLGPPAPPNGT